MDEKVAKKQNKTKHIFMPGFFILSVLGAASFLLFGGVNSVSAKNFTIYNTTNVNLPYFSVNGTTGNVGIGTTNPLSTLDVPSSASDFYAFNAAIGSLGIPSQNSVVMADPEGNLSATSSTSFFSSNNILSLWGGTKNGNIWNGDAGVGNVGIGTSTPGYKLDLLGNFRNTLGSAGENVFWRSDLSRANTSGDSAVWSFYTNTATAPDFFGKIGFKFEGGTATANKQFQISVANQTPPVLVVNGSGSVGIGTTTPATKLQVYGNGTYSASFMNGNVGIGTTNPAQTFVLNGPSRIIQEFDVANSAIGYLGSAGSFFSGQTQTDFSIYGNNHNIMVGGRSQPDLVVNMSGNVGIGTTTPATKLQVYGNGTYSASFMNGNVGIGTTNPQYTLDVPGSSGNFFAQNAAVGSLGITGQNSIVMADAEGNLSATSSASFINPIITSLWGGTKNGTIWNGDAGVGKVGIGTTAPVATLDINGNGIANSLNIINSTSQVASKTIGIANTLTQTAGNSGHQTIGTFNSVTYSGGNETVIFGIKNYNYLNTSGTVSYAYGDQSILYNNGAVLTNGEGLEASVINNSGTLTTGYGVLGNVDINGGQFNKLVGVYSNVDNASSNVTNNDAYGFYSNFHNSGVFDGYAGLQIDAYNTGTARILTGLQVDFYTTGGTTQELRGIDIGVTHPWTGTPTNSYGIYIDASTNIGTSTNYSIYSASTANSYFAGNVGIGTTNPLSTLDVPSSASDFYAYNAAVGSLGITGQNSVVMADPEGNLSATSSATFFASNSLWGGTKNGNIWNGDAGVGKVGIGTTNPGAKLSVSDGTQTIHIDPAHSSIGATMAGYEFNLMAVNQAFPWVTEGGHIRLGGPARGDGDINTIQFLQNGSEKMRINNGGNVGIGVTNPTSILQIPNNNWISALNNAGTGSVNMFKINASNQIEVGAPLNIGSFEFSPDSGLVTLADMPVSSASSINTPEGYSLKVDGENIMTIYSESNGAGGVQKKRVGINTINPQYDLDLTNAGYLYTDNAVVQSLAVAGQNSIVVADQAGTLYSTSLSLELSATDLNMQANDIINVNKLSVNTIDPLYSINGAKYSTYASSIVGGVKEEYAGHLKISQKNIVDGVALYEKVIDFDKIKEGDELWVWRKVIDFNKDNVEVLITPYGNFSNVYYLIEGNKIIFRSSSQAEISYRLIGKRFDWRAWPLLNLDSDSGKGLIIN